MKVKELIEKLKELDPEKNIWVFYDYPCSCDEPDFSCQAGAEAARFFKEDGCKVGDYYHNAG